MSAVTFFEVLYFFTIRLRATYLRLIKEEVSVRVYAKRIEKGLELNQGSKKMLNLGHK